MLGSLGWAWKPNSMAMWLGIVTCIPWGMLVASLPGVCNSWRDKVLHIWSLVSFLIGLVGVVFLVIYGGNIAEVRGPMIYMMWAIVSGFIVTLVIFLVWTIKHFLANGKSKDDDIVETVENDTNRILEEEAEAKKHLSNMLTGQTGTKGNPQQPQNIPIYINQRNQRLQVDQMGRPINPTGEPIFVIINNRPVPCDANGKPLMQRPSPSHQQGDYTQKASYEVQGLGTGQINEQFNSKHSGFLGSPQGRR